MSRRLAEALVLAFFVASCGGGGDTGMHMHPPAPTAIPDATHGPSTPDDLDGDGVPNAMDDCPSVANADQRNACDYSTPSPPAPTGSAGPDGANYLSWVRAQTGLGAVTEDATLSHGCMAHLNYLAMYSAEVGHAVLAHDEDRTKPYSTAEGAQAGPDSVLALGDATIEAAIDVWINSLYHRLPLLHPGLMRIGVGIVTSGSNVWTCIQYRPGTDGSVRAPHEIFWPPPDVQFTDRQFEGNEGPCPTAPDPLNATSCPAGGAIATLGLNGWGALTNVTATMIDVDTGTDVSLYQVYFDGGPSPHEQMGYLDGTVALIPQPGSSLDRATYEVTVNATVAGTPTTYRWRFRTGAPLPTMQACDVGHADVATAIEAPGGELPGKVCASGVVFHVGGTGARGVTLDYDYATGDLDMEQLDASGTRVAVSETTTDSEHLVVPAGGWVRVYGFNGAMGPYVLRVQ